MIEDHSYKTHYSQWHYDSLHLRHTNPSGEKCKAKFKQKKENQAQLSQNVVCVSLIKSTKMIFIWTKTSVEKFTYLFILNIRLKIV